jgi:hypothetical protein
MRRIVLALLLLTSAAQARSEKALAYPREQAWPAAVRFIRVDEQLKVLEKDADAGYVIFEMREEKKTFRGSLEVVDTVKDGRHVVRFVIQIEDRPQWVEIEMLNRLERKLRAELGSPAPGPTPAPRKEPEPGKPGEPKPEPPKNDGPPISTTP